MHSTTISFDKTGFAPAIAQCVLQRLAFTLSGACAAWMHQRQARATAHAPGLLDNRTLHDRALYRSKLPAAVDAGSLHRASTLK